MYDDNYGIINAIIMFIITVIIAWVAFSLILMWAKPALYNADGSVNWWTTLWVAAVVILLAWLIALILIWIWRLIFRSNRCAPKCAPEPKCEPKCPEPEPPCNPCKLPEPPCDPCARPRQQNGLWGGMW